MKTSFIFFLGLAAMLASCNSRNLKNQPNQKADTAAQKMVGGDVDEHGCKASAGYTWSAVLQECIRMWEKGVQMESLENPNATSAAYIVFSNDSSQVELFLPEHENHALLQRMHPVSDPTKEVWSSDNASNGLKVYQDENKFWVIEQDGKIQYKQVLGK